MKLIQMAMAAGMIASAPAFAQKEDGQPAEATDELAPLEEEAAPPENIDPDQQALIEQCPAFKFEREIKVNPNAARGQNVKICSNADATEDEWIQTLQDAVVQVEGQEMAPRFKEQLLGELRAEIARYTMRLPSEREPVRTEPEPEPVREAAVAQQVPQSTLAETTPEVVAPQPQQVDPPAFPSPAPSVAPIATTTPPIAEPREPPKAMLASVRCIDRGARRAITCDFLRKDTRLLLRATAGLEEGGTLRFLRRGDIRGRVELPPMANGKAIRVAIPRRVCAGVASSEIQVQLLRPDSAKSGAGSVATSFGPYGIRCR